MKSRKEEPVYGRIPYELRITYDPASSETDCECPLYSRHFYVNQGDPDRWKEKTGENYADIIFAGFSYIIQIIFQLILCSLIRSHFKPKQIQ